MPVLVMDELLTVSKNVKVNHTAESRIDQCESVQTVMYVNIMCD